MTAAFILLPLTFLLLNQRSPAAINTTSGGCSPIITHNSGTLNIHCTGLDPEVAKQLKTLIEQISSLNKEASTKKNQKLILDNLSKLQREVSNALTQPGIQINAPLQMNSTGDCNQTVIGNNNVNNCANHISFTAEQTKAVTDTIKNYEIQKGQLVGKVNIDYEVGPETSNAAVQLKNALMQAGIDATAEGAYIWGAGANDSYPGISFANVNTQNLSFAEVVGSALIQAKVIRAPINASRALIPPPGMKWVGVDPSILIIYIKKP